MTSCVGTESRSDSNFGFPQHRALFNCGVEIGQLLFVTSRIIAAVRAAPLTALLYVTPASAAEVFP